MTDIDQLLERLWEDYVQVNPQAEAVRDLLRSRGEDTVNDHLAFRTFDHPRIGIARMARPFLEAGYEPKSSYDFTEKKLAAQHFEHPDTSKPTVFISELEMAAFSPELGQVVEELVGQVTDRQMEASDFPVVGRPWPVSHATYERLREESEYAAWLAAWGFRANHFTILVNSLRTIGSLEALNALLEENGFVLNASGGKIKGTPHLLLEQSSTMASQAPSTCRHSVWAPPIARRSV